MPSIVERCAKLNARWRIDPVFHFLAVSDQFMVQALEELGCKDVTAEVRAQANRKSGVHVVGCERFAGMLVYNFDDGFLYHIDADAFLASPVSDEGMIGHFRGLGKADAYDVKYDFDSLEEAIEAFKGHARRAQLKWLGKRASAKGRIVSKKGKKVRHNRQRAGTTVKVGAHRNGNAKSKR
jgi:hypothetical protein